MAEDVWSRLDRTFNIKESQRRAAEQLSAGKEQIALNAAQKAEQEKNLQAATEALKAAVQFAATQVNLNNESIKELLALAKQTYQKEKYDEAVHELGAAELDKLQERIEQALGPALERINKIVNLEEYHVITAKKLVEAVIANPALRAILQPKIEATQNFAKRLIANNRIVQQHALELEKKLREIENRREAIKLQLRTEWLGVIEKSLKQVNKMQEQVGTLNLPPNRLSPTEANLTTALLYLQEAAGFVNHDRFDIADKRITAVENILKQVEKLTQGTIVAKEAAAELNALRDLPELELKR